VAAWSLQSDLHKKYSIETSFLMTRAGATRWQDFVYQSDQLDLKQGEAAKILRVRQVLEDEEIQSNEAEEEENEGDEKKRPAGPAEDNFNSTERR
jgi:type II secretory pathway component HofQ